MTRVDFTAQAVAKQREAELLKRLRIARLLAGRNRNDPSMKRSLVSKVGDMATALVEKASWSRGHGRRMDPTLPVPCTEAMSTHSHAIR